MRKLAKILLVDDEPDIIMLSKALLENNGYEVVSARNGNECLKKLKEEKFDLILLDVMMPGDNGWIVCKKIKSDEKTKDIPVVMFTVRTEPEAVAKSNECGAEGQINKPYERKGLLDTVKKVLEKSRG